MSTRPGRNRHVNCTVNYYESSRESEVNERNDGAMVWNVNIKTAI